MVLDLRMPSMTGWQLWDRMRADREWQSIAVLAVTGEGDATTRARDAGMCGAVHQAGGLRRADRSHPAILPFPQN